MQDEAHNPFMLTKNGDVGNGQANGSCVLVKSVTMKPNEYPFHVTLENGSTILCAYASNVDSIQVEHENPDIHIGNMFFLLETCPPNDAQRRRSLTIQIIRILNRYAQHNNSTLSGFLPTHGGFKLEEVTCGWSDPFNNRQF